jgi:COP9 signalosome complex subunit 1
MYRADISELEHRDLEAYYYSVGHYSTALNRYTKSREYCTTSQHGLDSDMCLFALEVCVLFYSLSTH